VLCCPIILLNTIEAQSLSEKPPIHLKLKIGDIEAEIECDESQLNSAVEKVIVALQEKSETLSVISSRSTPQPSIPKRQTCKTIITELWQEGWFSVSRNLGEVHEEMARRGYHYDRTAVAHTLVDLVREGLLTRQGVARHYTYVQKRPPS